MEPTSCPQVCWARIADILDRYVSKYRVTLFFCIATGARPSKFRFDRCLLRTFIRHGCTEGFIQTFRILHKENPFVEVLADDLVSFCGKTGLQSLGILTYIVSQWNGDPDLALLSACIYDHADLLSALIEKFLTPDTDRSWLDREMTLHQLIAYSATRGSIRCLRVLFRLLQGTHLFLQELAGAIHSKSHETVLQMIIDDGYLDFLLASDSLARCNWIKRAIIDTLIPFLVEKGDTRSLEKIFEANLEPDVSSIRRAIWFERASVLELARRKYPVFTRNAEQVVEEEQDETWDSEVMDLYAKAIGNIRRSALHSWLKCSHTTLRTEHFIFEDEEEMLRVATAAGDRGAFLRHLDSLLSDCSALNLMHDLCHKWEPCTAFENEDLLDTMAFTDQRDLFLLMCERISLRSRTKRRLLKHCLKYHRYEFARMVCARLNLKNMRAALEKAEKVPDLKGYKLVLDEIARRFPTETGNIVIKSIKSIWKTGKPVHYYTALELLQQVTGRPPSPRTREKLFTLLIVNQPDRYELDLPFWDFARQLYEIKQALTEWNEF